MVLLSKKPGALSDEQIDQWLGMAREQEWTELALLGPLPSGDGWANRLIEDGWDADRVLVLRKPLGSRFRRVGELTQLSSLVVYGGQLGDDELRALASLTNLSTLELTHCGVGDEGVRALAPLSNLRSLDLGWNEISDSGVASIARFSQLRRLGLSGNDIREEGARALAALSSLSALDLRTLKSRAFGANAARALAGLTNLTVLELGANKVDCDGARALAALSKLNVLNLANGEIGDEGASALTPLSELTSLDLSCNGLTMKGARALSALRNLSTLKLDRNRIGDEGVRALAPLTKLKTLDLTWNGITEEGAGALTALVHLERLTLDGAYHRAFEVEEGYNRVGDAGACALASLCNLTSLDLSGNLIGADGARALAALTNLTTLVLSYNRIGERGTNAFRALVNLTTLELSEGGLGDEGARGIAALTKLRALELSFNGIGDEGARALAALTGLEMLDLSDNRVGDAGAQALASLPNVTSLMISRNRVGERGTHAFERFALMRSLRFLSAHGNPARGLPTALLESGQCIQNLRAYFAELRKGAFTNDRVKVLLVGNGCVGKTTLAHCLMHGQAPPKPIEERTHGIVRQSIELDLGDGAVVTAQLWDFAGQELYHTTHRLFFHGNAIYLLLWAERTNAEATEPAHPVSYWLHLIQHLAANAPIILVKNQIDRSNKLGRPDDLAGRELGEIASIDISALKYQNVSALKASLIERADCTRHVWGYLLPESWRTVRAVLDTWRDAQRRVLSIGHFKQLCAAHLDDKADGWKVLLRYLHETGELFHDETGCDDSIVLDQNWFIDAIYRLFDWRSDSHSKALALGGRLSGAHAVLFWPGASEAEHQTYFDFMLRVGMAFEPERKSPARFIEREIVIPSLLPTADHPSLKSVLENWEGMTDGEWWLRFEYAFLHRAIVERMIVELSALSEARSWWRSGIVLRDPVTDCSIHVRADPSHGYVDVRLRRGRRAEAFARVMSLFERLHQERARSVLGTTDGEIFVDLAGVERARRRDEAQVAATDGSIVARSDYDRFIARPPDEPPLVAETSRIAEPVRVFVSYAHEDEPSKDMLEVHLAGIRRVLPIDYWSDRSSLAGATWEPEILRRLDVADVVVLLISPYFMSSDYCFSTEMAKALSKYEAGRGIPVPIIVRPTHTWSRHQIGQHQALPKDARAISSWGDEDEAWDDVSRGLFALLEKLAYERGLLATV